MARVTSSSDRAKRQARSSAVVRSSQGRPNRQRASTAQTTSSENRRSTGTARVTSNQDARRPPAPTSGRTDNVRVGPRSTGRAIPPAGGTNANSPRSQNQQAWTRDRGARGQLGRALQTGAQVFARATGIDAQSQAQARLNRAATGTRGEGVREGRPRPELGRPRPPAATSGRIQPVSVRDVTNTPSGSRPRLPAGKKGGAATTSRGGAVANIPEPRPRPGGRVVVDESPRLPAGKKGGDLTNGSERPRPRPDLRPRVTGAAAGQLGRGGALAQRSGDWGTFLRNTANGSQSSPSPVRTGQPGAERAALPAGRPSSRPAASGGVRGGRSSGRITGGIGPSSLRGNLAAGAIGIAADRLLGPLAQQAGTALGKELRQRLTPQRTGTQTGRTGRGGTTNDSKGKVGPAVPDRLTRQEATRSQTEPTRQLRLAQQSNNDAPRPTSRSTGSSGSSGSTTPSRPQRAAAAAPSPQSGGSTQQAPGTSADWKSFNPGRGTSRTNNPLIKKDDWLMGRINQREQASADKAINEGRASRARYSVQASPAEYNVSEAEGTKRLKIAEEERRKKKEQQAN